MTGHQGPPRGWGDRDSVRVGWRVRVDRQPEARRVDLATGVSVPYVSRGPAAAAPVLLLHAWGESWRSFDRLVPLLPATVHAMAMDQRGHGDADKPAVGYSLADFARDVVAFLDAVGISSAVLLGSSSGGYIAQQVAVTSPGRVAGLVLVGSPRSLRGRPRFADEVDQLTDPVDAQWVRELLRPPTESGTITAPALIVWGARDQLLTREDEQALAAAIPGSRLTVYEDTGHLVLWGQPGRVAVDLTAFAENLAGKSPGSSPAGLS
jgi:pimeloyl-ACP methyl ester carboxylesterase